MQSTRWQWQPQDPEYGNYGAANQWTVNAGLTSLARESAQNTNDARLPDGQADLVYTFIRLTGEHRRAFEEALHWEDQLRPHIDAMSASSGGAVAAAQLKEGLDALRGAHSLVLLRIADYGCRGLTGPEFAQGDESLFGNFVKLCRLDLFSGKQEAAGGSFGLGKAIYWRFSRLQTALFNSTVAPTEGMGGAHRNRVFGVQQGVVHHLGGTGYQGRGYFGIADDANRIRSSWEDGDLANALHLGREDDRPGTSALLVGFYDPDNPSSGLDGRRDLQNLSSELGTAIEENFWPLLARGGLRVRIDIEEDGNRVASTPVDGEGTFTELVHALRKWDKDQVSHHLGEAGAAVVRDVPIAIPARKGADGHPPFTHDAKLVVTLSDETADPLENKVCLFRSPEMIVETVEQVFDGRKYHAFLMAGAAIRPGAPTPEDLRADDFLRFAEPPAHDRWIPGSGRKQTSQANLTGRYVAPWVPSLRSIDTNVRKALFELFGAPPPPAEKAPESILKHLRFLRAGPGKGGTAGAPRKPAVTVQSAEVVDGRWKVSFTVRANNRSDGWVIEPLLALAGLDGGHLVVPWENLRVRDQNGDGRLEDGRLVLPHKPSARVVKISLSGLSSADLPVPAADSAVDVLLRAIAGDPVASEVKE